MFDNLPPELARALVTFAIIVLGAAGTITTTIVGAAVLWIRGSTKRSQERAAAALKLESKERETELQNLKTQAEVAAKSYEFVLSTANRLTDRVDKQDELIVNLREEKASDRTKIENLTEQLAESRQHSRERDERLGELKAKLEQATIDRDAMAKRVTELEDRQKERHEANTLLQIKIGQAEQERDAAREALKAANEKIATLEAQIKELTAPNPTPEVVAPNGAPSAPAEPTVNGGVS